MSDRGSSRGVAVNMAWCVMTYSGNHLGDLGSRYLFLFCDQVATGLSSVGEQLAPAGVYDLQGRRVVHPTQHGIYIIDGKKVAR